MFSISILERGLGILQPAGGNREPAKTENSVSAVLKTVCGDWRDKLGASLQLVISEYRGKGGSPVGTPDLSRGSGGHT